MSLVIVKSNAQLIQEEKTKANAAIPHTEGHYPAINSLAGFLNNAWEAAKKEKVRYERKMLENMRARNSEYEPSKLTEIQNIGAPPVFMGVTEVKTRNAEAWIKDIVFQPNGIPFSVDPTPVPQLPKEMTDSVTNNFFAEAMQGIVTQALAQGQPIESERIISQLQSQIPQLQKEVRRIIMEKAKEKAEDLRDEINDQLTEGKWYEAIDEFLPDVVLGTGILKGPILRRDYIKRIKTNDKGILTISTKEEIIPQYERRPPLDIYPGPGSTGINSTYLIDRLQYSMVDIQGMIGLPGFIESEIRAVLQEGQAGSLRDWTLNDLEKAEAEGRVADNIFQWDTFDCLEFWIAIQGKILHEYDSTGALKWKEKAPDPDIYYNLAVWKIGNHIIKAIFNKDVHGRKPFAKLSYIKRPGTFWGVGLPEVIADVQTACNACARALLYNVGMSSGPQVEINVDRLAEGEKAELVPWKRWFVTDEEAGTRAKAVEFYAPPFIAQQLIEVFNFYMKLADEHSGVPAYAHGDPQVGGGGNTASGLSMLMTQAARGIKLLVRNLDRDIIEDSIQRHFEWMLDQKEYAGLIGDLKIVAKGTSSLVVKEQQAVRMTELLSITANPIDAQIMGIEGRKKLLREVFRTHEMDPNMIIPKGGMSAWGQAPNPMDPGAGAVPSGAAPLEKPATLGPGGEPAQGTDFQTVTGRGGPASKPRVEGHTSY